MGWVPLHLSGRAYEFSSASETPAVIVDSVVYPDGSAARSAPWEIFVYGPATKLGITVFASDPSPLEVPSSFFAGGWYAYQTPIQGYRPERDASEAGNWQSVTDLQENDAASVITDGSTVWTEPMYLQYVAPRSGEDPSFQPNHYNVQLWVWDGDGPTPTDGACDEIGRVSRAFVSAHNRTRVHGVHVGAGERRCVVADYNGALPVGRSIARAEWRLAGDGVARMSEAAIPTPRQTQVQLHAQHAGRVMLRCLATLDNGEVYVQSFMVLVSPDPFADQAGAGGSLVLTAVAG